MYENCRLAAAVAEMKEILLSELTILEELGTGSFGVSYKHVVQNTIRGVRNPMKISDIGFLKTEPNRPQNSKTENSFSAVWFSKTDFGGLRSVFHFVSFTIHLAA